MKPLWKLFVDWFTGVYCFTLCLLVFLQMFDVAISYNMLSSKVTMEVVNSLCKTVKGVFSNFLWHTKILLKSGENGIVW